MTKPTPREGIDPDAIYVALTSGATDVPRPNLVIHQGVRLRGSHELVQTHPDLFARADLSDPEIEQIIRERHIRNR